MAMAFKRKILLEIIKQIILVKLCALAWIIFSPFLVSFLGIFSCLFILRKLVDLIVLKIRPEWRPVRALDSVFAAGLNISKTQTNCVGNIATVFVLETEIQNISIENIRKVFRTKVLHAEGDPFWKLNCVPKKSFGFYYWIPELNDDANLAEHIHVIKRMTKSEDELDDFLTNHWLSTSFDGRSPWEIILVEGNSNPNRGTKMCIRINQVIGGADMIARIVDALNGSTKINSKANQDSESKFWSRISMAYNLLMLPSTLCQCAVSAFWWDRLSLKSKSTEQVFATHVVHTNTVDRISRHFKCPFRTVLASTLGSAIRCFELESKKDPELSMYTKILINFPSARLNNTTTSSVKYPLRCSNIGERMSKTHEDVQFSTTNGLDSFRYYVHRVRYILPAFILKWMVGGASASVSICGTSDNEILKDKPFRILDYVLKNSYELVGLYGTKTGCLVKYTTAGKTIPFSIHADKQRIPTNEAARRVCEYFEQELEYLEEFVDTGEEYLHFPSIRIEYHKQLLAGVYTGYHNVGLSYPDIIRDIRIIK